MNVYATYLTGLFTAACLSGPSILHAQSCIPVTIPYSENFDGLTAPALPECTAVDNTNGDSRTWVSKARPNDGSRTGRSLYIQGEEGVSTSPADDWFYTKPLELKKDSLYLLQFAYTGTGAAAAGSGVGIASLEVFRGMARHPDSMTAYPALTTLPDIRTDLNLLDTVRMYFKPDRSGTWYIGFHSFSAHTAEIYVDNIFVDRAPADYVKDVEIITILEPAGGFETCPGTSFDAAVSFRNNGIDSLMDIPFILDLSGAGIQPVQQLYAGPLPPGMSDTVRFSQITLPDPGAYSLRIHAGSAGDEFPGNDTASENIAIAHLPAADTIHAVATGTLAYTFRAEGATHTTAYLWDLGDGNTATEATPVHLYSAHGTYPISVVLSNECGDTTLTYLLHTQNTLIHPEAHLHNTVSIYPNPASDQVRIELDDKRAAQTTLTAYDYSGRVVHHFSGMSAASYRLNVSEWTEGIYFIRIIRPSGISCVPLQILH